ncbi:MAG: N-acetylneuraminate synthase family protein [Candidatus Margulisiibacteriota bacterium]|nr:N-acetylneuraminate synthase family protein [Candidatus Margulisiibacteriota bacterium]
MANNHSGDVEQGLKIIRDIHNVSKNFPFKFAFKFQFRNLDTFIHPDYKGRMDIKYVKRFSETRLDAAQFKTLKEEIDKLGFVSICTPFDERSVDLIEEMNFSIIKIASCSFTDWPLLERIVKTDKPIIASTAGAKLEDIDKVVSFFEHRGKNYALMHCVAEYPTQNSNLQLNQIDLFKARYPQAAIGYSTHEDPNNTDAIKMAIAKGATLFERHVGVGKLNAYSSNPEQINKWLTAAKEAFEMCGIKDRRLEFTPKETASLRALGRGLFVKKPIKKGERISLSDLFLAIPTIDDQVIAGDFSKYTEFYAKSEVDTNQPILLSNLKMVDNREKIYSIVQKVKKVIKDGNVNVPGMLNLEISHHYGVDRFDEYGCTIINFINREYCKKLIILVPGQKHPEQFHEKKEETFHVLYGDVLLTLDGVEKESKAGDIITVERGKKHIFSSKNGAIIEEISSTHYKDDSFYTDPEIAKNKHRKSMISYWME